MAEPPPCKLLAFAPKLLVFRHGGAPSLPAASGCFLGSEAIFFYRVQKATLEIECLRQSPMKPSGVVFRRGGATSLQAACFCCKAIGVRHGGAPSLPAASGCFLGSKAIFFYRVQKATLEIECLRQSPMKPSGVVFRRGGATSLRAASLAPKAILLPDSERR